MKRQTKNFRILIKMKVINGCFKSSKLQCAVELINFVSLLKKKINIDLSQKEKQ